MSKKITQEYFDSIVKENIDEFEMEEVDALNDAIKQLESQTIDLQTILKVTANEQAEFLADLKQLESLVLQADAVSSGDIQKVCARLRLRFDKDISYRCYATKNVDMLGLFEKIFDAKVFDTQLQIDFLQMFNAYITTQNDILNSSIICKIIQYIQDNEMKFDLLDALLKCISTSCILNETNRQNFISNGLCELLVLNLLKENKFNLNLLNKICVLIRNLLLDDDIRVEFGKSHDNAKFIVSKLNGLDILLKIGLSRSDLNGETLGNIMLTLSRLAVRNEYCQEIYDKGGLKFAMKCLQEKQDLILIKSSLNLLKSICNNDIVKSEATKMDAVRHIVEIMTKYVSNAAVCELTALTAATLLLRNQEACERLVLHDGDLVIMQALNIHHKSNSRVIKACCAAIRNLVSRNKSLGGKLLNQNIEELLRRIMNQNDQQCYEEVKAALRDLDLKVDLKELWTGAGRQLAN